MKSSLAAHSKPAKAGLAPKAKQNMLAMGRLMNGKISTSKTQKKKKGR